MYVRSNFIGFMLKFNNVITIIVFHTNEISKRFILSRFIISQIVVNVDKVVKLLIRK